MHHHITTLTSALLALGISLAPGAEKDAKILPQAQNIISSVASMPSSRQVAAMLQPHGLHCLNLTWEDTGRWKGSSVGPNISDLTIQVNSWHQVPLDGHISGTTRCMPVIRFPNFSDRTGDVPLDRFHLLVGNGHGHDLRPMSLERVLSNLNIVSANAPQVTGSLLAERDSHVLVSAQANILPVPSGGETLFTPVLYNYQTRPGDPAVLVIVATPEGTSVQILDNRRDLSPGVGHGQRLFHDAAGQRAQFRARRRSDVAAAHGSTTPGAGPQADGLPEGLNLVMVIQVPLRQRRPSVRFESADMLLESAPKPAMDMARRSRGIEEAVIDAGPAEGPFPAPNVASIQRDERFPIRVTVQFYQASDTGTLDSATATRLAGVINRVYDQADWVGSLVTSGWTGRPTEPSGGFWRRPRPVKTIGPQPIPEPTVPVAAWRQIPWAASVLADHQRRTGQDTDATIKRLYQHFGPDWVPYNARELTMALATIGQ